MMNTTTPTIFPLGFPWKTQDPFLFCVYHLDHYPEGNEIMGPAVSLEGRSLGNDFSEDNPWRMYHGRTVPGFPAHPHRGFETITIAQKGYCDHTDSLGAAGRFGQGDVQWMTAGSGVQHAEMFPLLDMEHENTLELFQIWLNLPKKSKFTPPHFKMLWQENIPVIEKETAKIKIITGAYEGHAAPEPTPGSWANDENNEVAVWMITIRPNGSIVLPKVSAGTTRNLYFYEGESLTIGETELRSGFGAALNGPEDTLIEAGTKTVRLLLLQGKPIAEPVAQYGPFVMNNETEIQEAMDDYRMTAFGGWPWKKHDVVHPKEKGRFALYPDGRLEEK
ncbi:pirin family protein [Maribacter sp. 2-571]|uniref:pirin family protein n=1 Tax=Maribacter sp. 2-571 TaxID=3417569 RepID=UPI003D326CF0